MSKVYLRMATNFWLPISAEVGAVPNQVLALDAAMQFKSICGLQDPVSPTRMVRNAANTEWIPLDAFTASYPVIEGTVVSNNVSGNSIAVPLPSGIVAGELLVVAVYDSTGGHATVFTSPTSGWTRRLQLSNSTTRTCMAIFTRTATGSETTMTVNSTVPQIFYGIGAIAFRVSGADNANPIQTGQNTVIAYGANTNPTIFNAATLDANTLAILPFSSSSNVAAPFIVNSPEWTQVFDTGATGSRRPTAGLVSQEMAAGSTQVLSVNKVNPDTGQGLGGINFGIRSD